MPEYRSESITGAIGVRAWIAIRPWRYRRKSSMRSANMAGQLLAMKYEHAIASEPKHGNGATRHSSKYCRGRRMMHAVQLRERIQKRHVPHGALNRDELNALRRQSYLENKDAINDRRRESQRKLIRAEDNTLKNRLELRREKRRQQFAVMSEEQREAERAKARQQYRNRVARAEQRPPTAEESAKNWLEYRKSHGSGPTAEQSAQNWLAYRDGQCSSGKSNP